MKAELKDISPVKKSVAVEIPQEIVEGEIATIARNLARRARVPGFRPGKAPLAVVKTRYRDDIMGEMYQHLLPEYFTAAVKERDFNLVDSPRFEQIDYAHGQPLKFTAVFEIYPNLDVTNYQGIPLEEVPSEVAEEEIDAAVERLREQHAEMIPVEEARAVRTGDFVEISFSGVVAGAAGETPEIQGEKALCEIGAETTVREFSDNLTGAQAGEERVFDVQYRDDYPGKELAGRTVTYTVKVEALKEKKRPELDDEFAQTVGEHHTLTELRDRIRRDLEEHKHARAEQQMHQALLRWLEDHNEFAVPETLVEDQLDARLERMVRDLARQGVNPQRLDVDWGRIRAGQYEQAVRDVRGLLILDHIAEKEGIEATDDDVEAEMDSMATATGRSKASIREWLSRNDGLERMKGEIRNTKLLRWLRERAALAPAGSLSAAASPGEAGSGLIVPGA